MLCAICSARCQSLYFGKISHPQSCAAKAKGGADYQGMAVIIKML